MNTYQLGYQLHRTEHAVSNAMNEQLHTLNITSTQVLILIFIDRYADTTGARLANLAAVTPQTMHRTITSLEKREFIKRSRKPSNNKSSYLSLTPLGISTLRKAEERVKAVQDVASDHLQAEEIRTLHELLQKYEQAFRKNKGEKL